MNLSKLAENWNERTSRGETGGKASSVLDARTRRGSKLLLWYSFNDSKPSKLELLAHLSSLPLAVQVIEILLLVYQENKLYFLQSE